MDFEEVETNSIIINLANEDRGKTKDGNIDDVNLKKMKHVTFNKYI
jgi:hypothetical protein